MWLWRHGWEQVFGFALYLFGHSLHWREKSIWLREKGRMELLQLGLATLSLIIGVIMVVTTRGNAGSQLVSLCDDLFVPLTRHLDAWLIHAHLGIAAHILPHRIFGAIIAASSMCMVVAIYEWPLESERGRAGGDGYRETRLRVLLQAHLFSHSVAMAYWGGSFMVLLIHHPLWIPTWFSFALTRMHYMLYLRNNADYVKEKFAGREARAIRIRKSDADMTMGQREQLHTVLVGAEEGYRRSL